MSVTFLLESEGGRKSDAFDSEQYRPHLVVGDPTQRSARHDDRGIGCESYLGVHFTGAGQSLERGVEHDVVVRLVYPKIDYAALTPGTTFTVREGARVVGYGRVRDEQPNPPLQSDRPTADR